MQHITSDRICQYLLMFAMSLSNTLIGFIEQTHAFQLHHSAQDQSSHCNTFNIIPLRSDKELVHLSRVVFVFVVTSHLCWKVHVAHPRFVTKHF